MRQYVQRASPECRKMFDVEHLFSGTFRSSYFAYHSTDMWEFACCQRARELSRTSVQACWGVWGLGSTGGGLVSLCLHFRQKCLYVHAGICMNRNGSVKSPFACDTSEANFTWGHLCLISAKLHFSIIAWEMIAEPKASVHCPDCRHILSYRYMSLTYRHAYTHK